MKRNIIVLVLAPLIFLSGCKKWLDVKPKTIVEQRQLFTTEKGFEDAMYGVYTVMANSSLYGDQMSMSLLDVLAQNYDCQTRPTHSFYQASVYNYSDAGVKTRIANIWDSMYNAITNVNNILLNIDANKALFQSGNYSLVKGEALGVRAFLHFDVLRLFGPSFATGATNACIPYVTTVSGGVTPLSTVTEVLDKVIKDLQDASGLLSVNKTIDLDFPFAGAGSNDWVYRRQSHFNYWAAEATMARAYLYKGDKANALTHAANVINSGLFAWESTSHLNTYHDRTFVTEQVFALSKFNLLPQVTSYFNTPAGVINTLQDYQLTTSYGSGGVVDQIYEISSGGVTDIRYSALWQLSGSVYFCSKYWQDASRPEFANLVPLVRLPEMYYIAAECSSDVATATAYLNVVRENRGLADLPAGMDDATLQNEIFKEYEKEFYAEGQLWYYYKRTNAPQIRFSNIAASPTIYTFPLPDAEIQYRGGH